MADTYIFCNYEVIFPQSLIIFNTHLPVLSKMLCTSVVKFRASTLEHITQTLFQFVVICKMMSTLCILYRAKQVMVRGCQIWAVSRIGKKSLSHFCDCFTCVQAGVRPGIAVKEDVFPIGQTLCMHCCTLLKVLINHYISTALIVRCHCHCRLAALDLSLISVHHS
jgi:hypothetical protein